MLVGTRYSSAHLDEHYHAIVIGSGIGGLATAAVLARAGRRVLVLERHYTAGGFTHAYRRRGYEWDVGVHYIGDVHRPSSPIRRIFDALSDGALQWARMDDVYDRIIIGEDRYDFVAGPDRFRESLLASFPGSSEAIDGYLRAVKRGSAALLPTFLPRAMPTRMLDPLLARLLPGGGAAAGIFTTTTADVLGPVLRDPRLFAVLTGQWGDYGVPPGRSSFGMHALVAQHYLHGANYPVGGSSRIAATIVPGIERAGGAVVVGAGVEQILLRDGRAVGVRMADGAEIAAPRIISGTGVHHTYRELLPPTAAVRRALHRAAALVPSIGHLGLSVGLHGSPTELGLEQTNLWVYRQHDHDTAVARFLADPGTDLPVQYISFPSAKDPSWEQRHPGRSTIEVVSLAPYEWFRRWSGLPWRHRGIEYEEFKEHFAQQMLAEVERQVPSVRGRIDYYELSTPLSTEQFNGYRHGEMYGLEHSPQRFAARWLGPRTEIPGLYLTGQDTLTCGVGSVLLSGVLTAGVVLGPSSARVLSELFGITPRTAVGGLLRRR